MIVAASPRSVIPHCHNKPAMPAQYTVHGLDQQTGEVVATTLSREWALPGCRTWHGVGIGQPTPEYPTGTPYPMAHGFDCRGCMHLPPEFEALA